MTRAIFFATAAAVLVSSAAAADVQPNLRPGFNVNTGQLTVKNVGPGDAGRSIATVRCNTTAPSGCPDPAPAQIAPYENPAFPNAAAVKFKPIAGNSGASHTFPFYAGLAWGPGVYTLTVCVDAGKHVAESSEGDNCKRFRKIVRKSAGGPTHFKTN